VHGGRRGIIVVGHGTADPVGAEETRTLTRLVAERLSGVPVELGFLEVITPAIGDAVSALAARGCDELVAAPLLLFTAGHARRDVPEALAEAAAAAGVRVSQSEPLGMHPEIVQLSCRRRQEALAGLPVAPPEETVLVMMGRGSSDPSGPAQLHEFTAATLNDAAFHPAKVLFGFAAAARPTLDEAIDAAIAVPGVRRIIVQPHLLFCGHVQDQVSAALARGREARPDLDWVEVARLGADPRVATAVIDRAVAVGACAAKA
jgi:sirohydrochlorin cobaltochelatase